MIQDLLVVGSGFLIGVFSGAVGVGGGILMVPLLSLGFGVPHTRAQGTSLAAVIPISLVGAITHDRQGTVLRRVAVWIAIGGVVGAGTGSLLAIHLPSGVLVRLFGLLMLATAARMLAPQRPHKAVSTKPSPD